MKSLAVLSSFIIISVASLFIQNELTVSFKLPEKAVAGESFIMDITINKGDIYNFSKLQLNLPEGISAELIDGKGGTFTYYDQKLKLIWISLPEEPEFTVKIKLNTDPSVAGTFNLAGKISYILNESQRVDKELITPQFIVEPNNQVSQNQNQGSTTSTAIKTGITQSTDELSAERSLEVVSIAPGGSFMVEITVNKGNVTGLGKIIESLPEGFTATQLETNGAIFSVTDNTVKFLWMTLPAEEDFIVSYKVNVGQNVTGNKVIEGKISYLLGDETKNTIVPSSNILVTNNPNEPVVMNQPTTNPSSESPKINNNTTTATNQTTIANNTPKTETPRVDQAITNNNQPTQTTTNSDSPIIKTPETKTTLATNKPKDEDIPASDPEAPINHNVKYKVQICATKKPVETSYFVKNHNINEKISTEMHEGWHKFTVGEFQEYMKASEHRVFIRENKKIVGPFVSAYNAGKRITVQEALMITKDKHVDPTTF